MVLVPYSEVCGSCAHGAAESEQEPVVVDQATPAEDVPRVQLEIVNLVADGAPVQSALVGRVCLAGLMNWDLSFSAKYMKNFSI